ncbi:KEOPS complex subunit Pcc1 [Methanobrevibacter sp. DSM 116169]|uniref:KEOPS complex subunit Pcc1 n=1 Tax=Methanobrevibacter sp. DSM 116169 TaxID=3242727 RepID=UPI0038FC9868
MNCVKTINSEICIDLDDINQAKVVYDSVSLEINTAPDYRSSMDIELNGKKIIINIHANDSTSFRASINSAIKWINLSLEINKLIK